MNNAVSDPMLLEAFLLPQFREQVSAWLDAPASVAHWWSPEAALLDDAVQVLQKKAAALAPARVTCVFKDGDFLALLHRLNGLLAAAPGVGHPPHDHVGQLWILDRAERVSAEHIDILRRICAHYPELHIHLALFSRVTQAPLPADGVQVYALVPFGGGTMAPDGAAVNSSEGTRIWLWLLLAMLGVALAVAGWWFSRPVTAAEPVRDRSEMSAPPALPLHLPAAAEASEPQTPTTPAASQPEPSMPSVPEASSVAVAEPKVPAKPVPNAAASRRWLLGLPAGSLVVVHAQTASLREAEAFKAQRSVLVNARILPTAADGRPVRFLVVTGPFRSPERAQNYMQRLEWKSAARSVGRDELLPQVPR